MTLSENGSPKGRILMNEKYSEYLKDLPPELQEKAKDIKTQEELMEFLSDNDIELPEDALDAVSGGSGCGNNDDCPQGGKHDWAKVEVYGGGMYAKFRCRKCGKEKNGGNVQLRG